MNSSVARLIRAMRPTGSAWRTSALSLNATCTAKVPIATRPVQATTCSMESPVLNPDIPMGHPMGHPMLTPFRGGSRFAGNPALALQHKLGSIGFRKSLHGSPLGGKSLVPTRRRRRGMRLSPLDPFFDMDIISPFIDGEGAAGTLAKTIGHMAIDIFEDTSGYTVKANIPGLKKEDIVIDVEGDHISISARESHEEEAEGKDKAGVTFHRMERSSEYISRTFHMPENADMESIDATYTDGVLSLKIGKKTQEANGKRQIAIQ